MRSGTPETNSEIPHLRGSHSPAPPFAQRPGNLGGGRVRRNPRIVSSFGEPKPRPG